MFCTGISFFHLIMFKWLLKEAEISASTTLGATRSLDSAQKKGSAIFNLKCVDVQVLAFSLSSCYY